MSFFHDAAIMSWKKNITATATVPGQSALFSPISRTV
jgi:hypothetical protein